MSGQELAKQEGKDWSGMSSKEKHKLDAQAHVKTLVKEHRLDMGSKDDKIAAHPVYRVGNSPTHNALMLQAKAKGIKNFRVMNKAELEQVLAPTVTQEQILVVATGAVARWKGGKKVEA